VLNAERGTQNAKLKQRNVFCCIHKLHADWSLFFFFSAFGVGHLPVFFFAPPPRGGLVLVAIQGKFFLVACCLLLVVVRCFVLLLHHRM